MISALVLSTLISAFPGGAGPEGHQEEEGFNAQKLMMILKTVDLSPDQWKQVHQVLKATHQQVAPLRKQVREAREQIADKLTGTTTVAASDIASLRTQIQTAQQQIDDQALQAVIEIRALMTPQQLQQMQTSHQKFKALRQEYESIMKPNQAN